MAFGLIVRDFSAGRHLARPGQHLDREEVRAGENIHVPANEVPPGGCLAPLRHRGDAMPAQDIADSLVGHRMPEVGQCSYNPVVAPAGVLADFKEPTRNWNGQALEVTKARCRQITQQRRAGVELDRKGMADNSRLLNTRTCQPSKFLKKRYVVQNPDAVCSAKLMHHLGLKGSVTGAKHIRFTGYCCLQNKVIVRIADNGRKALRQVGKRAAFAQKRRVPFNRFWG